MRDRDPPEHSPTSKLTISLQSSAVSSGYTCFFLLLIIKHTIYRPTDAAAVSKGELVLKTDITKCSEAGGESWCKRGRFLTILAAL